MHFSPIKMSTYFGTIGIILLLSDELSSQPDPCSNYQAMQDVTMKSDFILHFGQTPLTGTNTVGWVRYTATKNGSLMSECPTKTNCGVLYQYWMNDTIPSEDEDISTVAICGRADLTCCAESHEISIKNCSDYVVYKLKPTNGSVRYCFAADPTTTTTTTTTISTTTFKSSNITDTESAASVSVALIAAIVGTILLVAIVIVIVCIIIRKRKKLSARSVGYLDENHTEWQTLNIAAIYRTKRKDLLIPRLMYLSGKQRTNSSMVYLNPRDEDFVDMKEQDALPRTHSELDIFSPPEIKRLGIDISAVYQTRAMDKFVANTRFSSKYYKGDNVMSVFSLDEYLPYYNLNEIKYY